VLQMIDLRKKKTLCMKKFFLLTQMFRTPLLLLLFTFFLWCTKVQGQTLPDSVSKANRPNKAMLAHYTAAELDEIKTLDPAKYQTIFYYYTQSYLIQTFDCNDCVPRNDFSDFDVFVYEKYRQQSSRRVLPFEKYGYRLILLSVDELAYQLPIHQP
jgi:hypothetical protein